MAESGSTNALPRFPSPFDADSNPWGAGELPKTLHEMKLASFEGAICDKPGWWAKIDHEPIVARWRAEMRAKETDRMAVLEGEWRRRERERDFCNCCIS